MQEKNGAVLHMRYRQENEKLKFLRNQSRSRKLEGTLLIRQWLETLHYFRWNCAYCQTREYEHIDHFIS
jgi:hypothetical protein